MWLEYGRSVWLSLLYLLCPVLASSVSTVLTMLPSFLLFWETVQWHISCKYKQWYTHVCAAVTMSLHRKSCLCSFSRNQYAVNRLIRSWVSMCFCTHVPLFCDTILWYHFDLFLLWLSLVWTCLLHQSTPPSSFRDIKVSHSGHATLIDYTVTSVVCCDRLLI